MELDAHYQFSKSHPDSNRSYRASFSSYCKGLKGSRNENTEGTLKKGEVKDKLIGRGPAGGEADRAQVSQSPSTQVIFL